MAAADLPTLNVTAQALAEHKPIRANGLIPLDYYLRTYEIKGQLVGPSDAHSLSVASSFYVPR